MTLDLTVFTSAITGQSKRAVFYKDKCLLGEFLDTLTYEEFEVVSATLDDRTLPSRVLMLALRQVSFQCGQTSIKAHRRKECPCYRKSN
jgi:hypothetical protein